MTPTTKQAKKDKITCPICGKFFPTTKQVMRHYAICAQRRNQK